MSIIRLVISQTLTNKVLKKKMVPKEDSVGKINKYFGEIQKNFVIMWLWIRLLIHAV